MCRSTSRPVTSRRSTRQKCTWFCGAWHVSGFFIPGFPATISSLAWGDSLCAMLLSLLGFGEGQVWTPRRLGHWKGNWSVGDHESSKSSKILVIKCNWLRWINTVDLRSPETISLYVMHVQFCWYLCMGMVYKLQAASPSLLQSSCPMLSLVCWSCLPAALQFLHHPSSAQDGPRSTPSTMETWRFVHRSCATTWTTLLGCLQWSTEGQRARCAKCLIGTANAHLIVKLNYSNYTIIAFISM